MDKPIVLSISLEPTRIDYKSVPFPSVGHDPASKDRCHSLVDVNVVAGRPLERLRCFTVRDFKIQRHDGKENV